MRTIYTITNKHTGALYYVGSTINMKKRRLQHKYYIRFPHKTVDQKVMYNALHNIGSDNLVFTEIEKGTLHTELFKIMELKPLYNIHKQHSVKNVNEFENWYKKVMNNPYAMEHQIEAEHNSLADDEYINNYIKENI